MQDDVDLAEEILGALSQRRQIPLMTSRPGGLSLDRAYRLSALIETARAQRGEHPVGRKIGFTNMTIWDQFNVSAPVFGPMYDSTVHPLGAPFETDTLMEPRIEPEIAFRLAATPLAGMSPEDLMTCISGVCAGFEMVQSPFASWKFEAADTVAAFGLHGAFLHGQMLDLSPSDRRNWAVSLSSFETTLLRDDVVADKGHARNVLGGGPLAALSHLVDLLAGMPDVAPLKEGDVVTTGTLTQALPVSPGETWQAILHGLPLDRIKVELM